MFLFYLIIHNLSHCMYDIHVHDIQCIMLSVIQVKMLLFQLPWFSLLYVFFFLFKHIPNNLHVLNYSVFNFCRAFNSSSYKRLIYQTRFRWKTISFQQIWRRKIWYVPVVLLIKNVFTWHASTVSIYNLVYMYLKCDLKEKLSWKRFLFQESIIYLIFTVFILLNYASRFAWLVQ